MHTAQRNLRRAAFYNLVGIALAAAGILHPVAAALLMVGSSLLVAWSSVRIGISSDWCGCIIAVAPTESTIRRRQPWLQAAIHTLSLSLQAVVLCQLLGLSQTDGLLVSLVVAVVGTVHSVIWLKWETIPHSLDMTFGMLTLGNLGMVLGWYADNKFAPLQDVCCCEGTRNAFRSPWMSAGMLACGAMAMTWLGRRPHPEIRWCKTVMFTGGSLGMLAGMMAGGQAAAGLGVQGMRAEAIAHFLGMTFGMIAGMLMGMALMHGAIEFASGQWARILRRWRVRLSKPEKQNTLHHR